MVELIRRESELPIMYQEFDPLLKEGVLVATKHGEDWKHFGSYHKSLYNVKGNLILVTDEEWSVPHIVEESKDVFSERKFALSVSQVSLRDAKKIKWDFANDERLRE